MSQGTLLDWNASALRQSEASILRKEEPKMAGILWTIIVILFIFWLLGFLVWHAGGIIHLLLVVAVIVLLFNLFTGRRTVA